jgi:hypothetical protein
MVQVCSCIGGALVLFAAMMFWATNGRLKSENNTDI